MAASKAKTRLSRFIKRLLSSEVDSPPPPEATKQDEWSIGVYFGHSPFYFVSPETVDNPVLTRENVSDVEAAYVTNISIRPRVKSY